MIIYIQRKEVKRMAVNRDFENDPIRRAITDRIFEEMNAQGRKGKWMAERLGEKYTTFTSKKKFGSWTAIDLIRMGILLNMDLNQFKELEVFSNL